jgi:ribonuclease VapC
VAEIVVLDTSACLTLLENEPGAETVESLLLLAKASRATLHGCFITLTETEYIVTQERGLPAAAKALAALKTWPVIWHHSDDDLCHAAARLKAAHKISLGDSFIAATALRVRGSLLHKDPEFKALAGFLPQQILPFKTRSAP